jgi:hypothetical protein
MNNTEFVVAEEVVADIAADAVPAIDLSLEELDLVGGGSVIETFL